MVERIFHKSRNFKEAEEWDIKQQISMSSEERQMAAKELRERVFGKNTIDIRESYKRK